MDLVELTYDSIDPARVLAIVASPAAGGEVLFVGVTRRLTAVDSSHRASPLHLNDPALEPGSITTDHLFYEAYQPMATKQLDRLVQQARKRWPLEGVAIVHRLGKVLPQEPSIAIAVSSAHRAEAFEACRWLIDNIKRDVPIWKREIYLRHEAHWVHPEMSLGLANSQEPEVDCSENRASTANKFSPQIQAEE